MLTSFSVGKMIVTSFIVIGFLNLQSVFAQNNNSQFNLKRNDGENIRCLPREAVRLKSRRIVSFGQINNRAFDIPKPSYPKAARAVGVFGKVEANILVGEKGDVVRARLRNGHPLLKTAVKKVICQARFNPTRLSGNPVAVYGIIVYDFVLP